MAWIESHEEQAVGWHARRLCRKLGVSLPEAVGRIHMLWHYAAKAHPLDELDVLTATDWQGDERQLIDALLETGYIEPFGDGLYEVADWWKMGGKRSHIERERSRMTPSLRGKIIERDDGVCSLCRTHTDEPHVDHIIALANGGRTEESNLQVLCRRHNLAKGDR